MMRKVDYRKIYLQNNIQALDGSHWDVQLTCIFIAKSSCYKLVEKKHSTFE